MMTTHAEIMTEGARRLRTASAELRASGEDNDREAMFERAFYTAVGELLTRDD